MKKLLMAIVATLALASAEARATDEAAFLGVLKRFGVTADSSTSKKPCLCSGGGFDGTVGGLVVSFDGGIYRYDCVIPFFLQGSWSGEGSCAAGGGSAVALSK
jgi:hypothetical protein